METKHNIYEQSPVDIQQLKNAALDDEDLMRELLEIYFSETEKSFEDLKSAVSEKDAEKIYRTAHKLVGGSLTCGMIELIPHLRKLEEIGKKNDTAESEKTLESAIQASEKMKNFLVEKNLI